MSKRNQTTTLRVIAGDLKGQKLVSPHSTATHPMGARVKNALFNMVDVQGKRVLDAYAGSGALGIEALSRGAREVTFVENHRQAISAIRQNLVNLSLTALAQLFADKVDRFIQDCAKAGRFDVIIADPPYDQIDFEEIKCLSTLLADGGVMALSSPASQPVPEITGLTVVSSHSYAEARVTTLAKV